MGLTAISAPYIIVSSELILRDAALVSENGDIVAVDTIAAIKSTYPSLSITHYESAILCAGFINAHTHLELSFIGAISKFSSFFDWVGKLNTARSAVPAAEQATKNERALRDVFAEGTIGFGDITNGGAMIPVLDKLGITHHSFIEVLGLEQSRAESIWQNLNSKFASELARENISLSPHAPYSVSRQLLSQLAQSEKLMSIHIDELSSERDFLESAEGEIRRFVEAIGVWDKSWKPPRISPQDYLTNLGFNSETLRVHNLQTSEEELLRRNDAHFILCPRSNFWLHQKLANAAAFEKNNIPFALGTDSLASCADLSILNEMKFLKKHSDLNAKTIFKAGSETGAEFLRFNRLGTLARGKRAICNLYRFGVLSADPIEQLLTETASDHALLQL